MAARMTAKSSKKKDKQRGIRDTLKVLAFVQLVLLFCAGAIPEPFKLFAFAPVITVMGAGVFWSVATGIGFVREHAKLSAGAAEPATVPTTARGRSRTTKIVKISKIA